LSRFPLGAQAQLACARDARQHEPVVRPQIDRSGLDRLKLDQGRDDNVEAE
jgi:hypothetical protein